MALTLTDHLGGLPRRDLWLLPLVGLCTLVALVIGSELAARVAWPEQTDNTCRVADPVYRFRYRPNCTATMKAAEGPWFTAAYNDCGYRSATSCAPVPPGTRRVVLTGSSTAEGTNVAFPATLPVQLADVLSAGCGKPVDVQNVGALGFLDLVPLKRMDEAFALNPTALVFVITPHDIQDGFDPEVHRTVIDAPPEPTGLRRLLAAVKASRAVVMAQHFLFHDPAIYLPLYLHGGDQSNFLVQPFPDRWQKRLDGFDAFVAAFMATAKRKAIPVTIAFVPQEAQLGLMARLPYPPGVDADALPRAIGAIAARHGAAYVDTSAVLRQQPAPELLFYQVDGHLAGHGLTIAARDLGQDMLKQAGPFGDCRQQTVSRSGVAG